MPRWPVFLLLLLSAQAPITLEQPLPNPAARELDIMGLKIGQTPEQVHAILTAQDPGGRLTDRVIPGIDGRPFTESVRLSRNIPLGETGTYTMREDVQVAFSGKASGNRAIAIERRAIYVGNSRDAARPLLDALRMKYGPSPEEGRSGAAYDPTGYSVVTWRWLFGPEGQLLRAGAAPDCPNGLGQYRPDCPVQLTLALRVHDAKLEGLTLDLKDHAFAIAALAVDHEADLRERARNAARAAMPFPK